MKIESINIKNFKGLESYEGDIDGMNVYLIGGNGTGKSSFIEAVWCGLTGKNFPSEPTTDGAKKGLIEIDLGEFIARTKITRGKPIRFELENKEFTKESERFVRSPRSYLESRVGILDFDINKFFTLSDKEQVKYFAKVVNCDFSDLDSEIEEITESRKFDKKELAQEEAKNNFYDKKLAARELIDIVELSKKISTEKEKATTYSDIQEGIETRKERVLEIDAQILALQIERDGHVGGEGQDPVKGLSNEISDGNAWLEDKDNQPLTGEALKELTDELETANETNEKISEAKEAAEAEKKVETLREAIEEANDEIDKKREAKAKRISDNISIEGLEYDVKGERFLYNGLPFERSQINTAEQLIAGMKIGSMMLKDLKILKVDASLIDNNNLSRVHDWAKEEGVELFVELVDREAAKLEIIVTDAEIS